MEEIRRRLEEDGLLHKLFTPTSIVNGELSYTNESNINDIAILQISTKERVFFKTITAEEIIQKKHLQKITYMKEAGGYEYGKIIKTL
jgi:hypothetical protein